MILNLDYAVLVDPRDHAASDNLCGKAGPSGGEVGMHLNGIPTDADAQKFLHDDAVVPSGGPGVLAPSPASCGVGMGVDVGGNGIGLGLIGGGRSGSRYFPPD